MKKTTLNIMYQGDNAHSQYYKTHKKRYETKIDGEFDKDWSIILLNDMWDTMTNQNIEGQLGEDIIERVEINHYIIDGLQLGGIDNYIEEQDIEELNELIYNYDIVDKLKQIIDKLDYEVKLKMLKRLISFIEDNGDYMYGITNFTTTHLFNNKKLH